MNNLHYFSIQEVKSVSEFRHEGIVAYTAIENSMMNGTKSNYKCLFDLYSLAKTLEVTIEKLFEVAEFDVIAKNDLYFIRSSDTSKVFVIGYEGASSLARTVSSIGLIDKSLGNEVLKTINLIIEQENKER